MSEITVEKEESFKKLNKDDNDELASIISKWWTKWHQNRESQLDTAQRIQKLISLNQEDRNKKKKWKSNIKENKVYTTWDSMKSGMWKEIWSNEAQMFDVVAVSKEFEEAAQLQKEALCNSLKKMNAGAQYDIAVDNWGIYGDFIFKTDWKKHIKKVKRFNQFRGFEEIQLPLYENANIEAINPMFFVWDVTKYKLGKKETWDSCPKIFKRFETIENIKNNPQYKLTKEQIEDLDDEKTSSPVDCESDRQLADLCKYGEMLEVLYFHGDLKFNGVRYKNVVIEVLARKYIIRFEQNPIYINPFIVGFTEIDPYTKRGISPLKSILDMAEVKEEKINQASDIATLNANPPHWVSDAFLKEKYRGGVIEYEPGKCLEYENSYQGGFPQAVKFDAGGIKEIVSILANNISDTSSINANAMGNVEQGKRLATDLQLAQRGTESRTAMKLDKIYQINLSVIENIAELLAMFKDGSEFILSKEKGQYVEIEITNAIRQGNYQYYYEDRNALIDRRAKFQEAFQMLNASANNPELFNRIDWLEALKTGLEMIGFDNADKFFKEPSQIDNITNIVKQMPSQFQDAIMQNIQPMLEQAQIVMQKQKEVTNE